MWMQREAQLWSFGTSSARASRKARDKSVYLKLDVCRDTTAIHVDKTSVSSDLNLSQDKIVGVIGGAIRRCCQIADVTESSRERQVRHPGPPRSVAARTADCRNVGLRIFQH